MLSLLRVKFVPNVNPTVEGFGRKEICRKWKVCLLFPMNDQEIGLRLQNVDTFS